MIYRKLATLAGNDYFLLKDFWPAGSLIDVRVNRDKCKAVLVLRVHCTFIFRVSFSGKLIVAVPFLFFIWLRGGVSLHSGSSMAGAREGLRRAELPDRQTSAIQLSFLPFSLNPAVLSLHIVLIVGYSFLCDFQKFLCLARICYVVIL